MKLIGLFFLLLSACNSAINRQYEELGISIKFDHSYQLDLGKGEYTIYYMMKQPDTLKFNLSAYERRKINEEYFSLGLNEFPKDLNLRGYCDHMPVSSTYIIIKSKSFDQRITITENCDLFGDEAGKIKKLLQLIKEISEAKPEIKNAPESGVTYI